MNVKEVVQRSSDREQAIEVVADGMMVVAKAGAFKVGDEELELPEDFEYDVETSTSAVWLDAFLVREVATGVISLLIDERVSDGVVFDDPYIFEGGPYEELFLLYSLGIKPNTTSLDDLTLILYRMQLEEPQPQEEPSIEEPADDEAPPPPPTSPRTIFDLINGLGGE